MRGFVADSTRLRIAWGMPRARENARKQRSPPCFRSEPPSDCDPLEGDHSWAILCGGMPELPDVTIYKERLCALLVGKPLRGIRLANPFTLRTVEPSLDALPGRVLRSVERSAKRLVFTWSDPDTSSAPPLYLVLHLMIAGRLKWRKPGASTGAKMALCAFDFDEATLLLTEAGSKRRASLHLFASHDEVHALDRGGLEVMDATSATFTAAMTRENRTLKRALTDPRILSGIGNAYSDEILHAARLSPMRLTSKLVDEELQRLFEATQSTLQHWTDTLRKDVGDGFPEKVTAFRPGMAVHGRYREPCPHCSKPVQRIRYADNECNYCAECQNAGRLLADRGLSKLLKKDWPKTLAELEELRPSRPPDAGKSGS